MKSQNFKTLSIITAIMLFTFTSNVTAQGQGANTGGPANTVGGVGQGAGGPGDSFGPGQGAGQGNPQKDKDKGDTIPLDGGLSILLAGAAIFGIRKLREKK